MFTWVVIILGETYCVLDLDIYNILTSLEYKTDDKRKSMIKMNVKNSFPFFSTFQDLICFDSWVELSSEL